MICAVCIARFVRRWRDKRRRSGLRTPSNTCRIASIASAVSGKDELPTDPPLDVPWRRPGFDQNHPRRHDYCDKLDAWRCKEKSTNCIGSMSRCRYDRTGFQKLPLSRFQTLPHAAMAAVAVRLVKNRAGHHEPVHAGISRLADRLDVNSAVDLQPLIGRAAVF